MANNPNVQLNGFDALVTGLQTNMDQQFKRIIAGNVLNSAAEATSYAKKNAPWTDRTGNARSGLNAKASVSDNGNTYELILAHSVFYGMYLETRWSGKYSIIMPTLNVIGKQLMSRIADSMSKVELPSE